MKILFLHFPKDNTQIEGTALPKYFSKNGHECFLAFEKKSRTFFCELRNGFLFDITKDQLLKNNFDLIVGKSDCFQSYDKRYFKNSKSFKVNILTLGLKRNILGTDYCFKDDQLIKAPPDDMSAEFHNYKEYSSRQNFIYTPASIGTDKNQLEFIDLVEPQLIDNFTYVFSGPIRSKNYFQKMVERLDSKNIKWQYLGHLNKGQVAKVMKSSKILCLTTDPRPAQPYDPSPRVLPESACAGTPFLVNDLVIFNSFLDKFGAVYKNGNKLSLNNALQNLLLDNLDDLSKKMHLTALEKLNMPYACQSAYQDIMTRYERGRK